MLEIEEIMDEEETVEDYKINLNAFLKKFPEVAPLWRRITNDILPAFYANMYGNKLYYYMDFRILDKNRRLYWGIFPEGKGNLQSAPNNARIKAYIGDVTNWDKNIIYLLIQYTIAKLIYDKQIIVAGYGDTRGDMTDIMKLIRYDLKFDLNGYAWEMFRQVQVSFTIGTHY